MIELKKEAVPIEVENITFSYEGEKSVLQDFSLCLSDGEKVMLMGESGCGKSTLLKLIMRFYQGSGSIRLYGREAGEYSLFQLRQLITYIPQRSYLFEGTIRENIAIGSNREGSVPEEEIVQAARLAYADEFIRTFPKGYDTVLEAGGSNLSVGQRQRIAIARAFLKDSPILLMDEPSSALDVHSEMMVNRAIGELMKEKVVIMVTHRSGAAKEFDRIVSL